MPPTSSLFRVTIFTRILLAVMATVAVPIIGLWYFNTYKFQVEIEDKVSDRFHQQADIAMTKVNTWLAINKRLLKQNVDVAAIDINGFEWEKRNILQGIVNNYEWVYQAFTLDNEGYISALSDNTPIYDEGAKAFYRGNEKYFEDILNGRRIGTGLLFSKTHNSPAFVFCIANYITSIGLVEGALCTMSTVADVSEAIKSMNIGSSAEIMLLDDRKNMIAYQSSDSSWQPLQNMSRHIALRQAVANTPYQYKQADGADKVAYSVVMDLGLQLVIQQNTNEAYREVIKSRREGLLFISLTLFISLVMIFVVARHLSRPIVHLTAVADAMSKGQFFGKLKESSRGDEIGELAQAIERMGVSIHLIISKIKKAKQDRQQQQTINPSS